MSTTIQSYFLSGSLQHVARVFAELNGTRAVGAADALVAAVVQAVKIPVLGGFGGGPWLDGRMRMAHAAIGYAASALESKVENYANVAKLTLEAISAYAVDVREGRQIKGAAPAKLP